MSLGRRSGNPSERDLASFADGSMPAAQRGKIERALSDSPELRSAVAAQRRVLSAIDAASRERAPSSLRAQVSLIRAPGRRRGPGRLGVMLAASAVAAGTAAVVAVVLVLGGQAVAPTVAQAAILNARLPQGRVAEPPTDRGILPSVRAAGLTYPYWQDRFGYRAVGVRYDRLAGRRITTVFYRRGSSRVAYEIVSGGPLRLGGHAWSTVRQGVRLWAMETRSGLVVSWLRHGHTCILIGAATGQPVLLHLAAWDRGGRVPY
jgi:hypothetical protein